MAQEHFRTLLKAHLRRRGYKCKQLAEQLGMQPGFLSNKLNGYTSTRLSYPEVKQMVLILAQWQAVTTIQEALELLA